MHLRSIEVISIPVRDQDAALAFYREKLGCRVLTDSVFEEGMRWVQLTIGAQAGPTISLVTWFENMQPGSVQGLILTTDDIEADYQALKDAGVDTDPVVDTPWGRFARFRDLDGNGWSLHQG